MYLHEYNNIIVQRVYGCQNSLRMRKGNWSLYGQMTRPQFLGKLLPSRKQKECLLGYQGTQYWSLCQYSIVLWLGCDRVAT